MGVGRSLVTGTTSGDFLFILFYNVKRYLELFYLTRPILYTIEYKNENPSRKTFGLHLQFGSNFTIQLRLKNKPMRLRQYYSSRVAPGLGPTI